MGKRKYILNQNFFDDIDTEEKAYWLGFLYADGYNNEKRKEVKIRLAIKDEEHLLKLRDTLYIKKDRPLYYGVNFGKNKWCELIINSTHFSKQLAQLGCVQAKTFIVRFPSFLQEEYLKRAFIRGVFDGDGSISLTRHYTGCPKYIFSITGNIPFLLEVQQELMNFCKVAKNKITSNNRENRSNQIGLLTYGGGEQCKRIRKWLYKDATIFLSRKKEKFFQIGTDEWHTFQNRKIYGQQHSIINCNKCDKDITYRKHYDKDNKIYCYHCFNKLYGIPKRKRTYFNNIQMFQDYGVIYIKDKEVLFDCGFLEKVKALQWHIENNRVIHTCTDSKSKKVVLYLHRYLFDLQENQFVKFINGNSLDCRKENLKFYEKNRTNK